MSSNVDSETASPDEDSKALGVRFAESTVGEPIIASLLFIAGSFWLILAAIGVLITLVAMAIWDGVMAGVIGVFGLSGIFVGLLGYGVFQLIVYIKEDRD